MTDTDPFDEIERVFGLMSQQFGTELAGVPTDVIDDGDAYVVRADLPGYDSDDVEVTLSEGRQLRIDAEREEASVEEDGRFVQRERRAQSASRTVTLPERVEEAETEASYDRGVLTVRLPKQTAEDDEGTEIPVN
ncbi:MAG: Hsp20/alpha crystallin family protein [Haloarculaceae archaeon]